MIPPGLPGGPATHNAVAFRPTRRDVDPDDGGAAAEALWDLHDWVEGGWCWLWCGRADVEVTWLGPVQSSGMHAAMYACRACLYALDQLVLVSVMHRDGTAPQPRPLRTTAHPRPRPSAPYAAPPARPGRHRRPLPSIPPGPPPS